jgi:hypothetical protein
LNLIPGKKVQVENKLDAKGSLIILVEGERCTIDNELASIIYVKKNGEVSN